MSSKVSPINLRSGQPEESTRGPVIGPKTSYQESSRGLKLHCSSWKPTGGNVKGLVFLCHGFGEYLLWYEDLAHRLASCGLIAFGHDHVGHGKSEGVRGHISTIEEYTTDVLNHCEKMTKEHGGKPCFLIGHSMGGMIAIRAATSRPLLFDGVVLMGPLIQPDPEQATPFRLCVAKAIASVLPLLPVGKLELNHVTRDKEMRKKLAKDSLRYNGGVRAGFAMACHSELAVIQESMPQVTWPFLILHGANDKLCSPDASNLFYKNARSNDKKIKVFPNAYHHLYIEIPEVRREALQDTVDWITIRLNKLDNNTTKESPDYGADSSDIIID